MANESGLQKRCLDWIKDNRPDLLPVNNHGGGWGNKGFPDVTVYGHGRCIQVELKDGDAYKVQPAQKIWRRRFAKVGVSTYVARSFEEFQTTIEKEYGNEAR